MSHWSRRGTGQLLVLLTFLAAMFGLASSPARAAACPGAAGLEVDGAELQRLTCLDDLTTVGTVPAGYSVQADWNLLNDARTAPPSAAVPGLQIDGYFPDMPAPAPYTPNPFNGWNHDAQFVIRLPAEWNGKLVIAPPPGNRRQYSSDFIIGDYVLARGYAYASTDKGNWNFNFFLDGAQPGDAVAEWHDRVRQLTVATIDAAKQYYGKKPKQVYLFGISNGGYQVRYAIERDPQLYDGGVDWEGTLFTADGPNLFTYLPAAMRYGRVYADPTASAAARETARQGLLGAGFAPGSEFLWTLHYNVYWDLTQRVYREEFDPSWDGDLVPNVFVRCDPVDPLCDANYDYASRPAAVKAAVAGVSMTGKIRRPLITVQGSLDSLITPANNADPYAALIASKQRTRLHRAYLVEGGQHVDGFVPAFGGLLRPVLPCARAAFVALEGWVEAGQEPPPSGTIARGGDELNSCALP